MMEKYIFMLMVVCCFSEMVLAGTQKRPCKFGDKIEYGKLGTEVNIPGNMNAYVSHPNNTKSKGGVIIAHDIHGWETSNTRAMADMLRDNNFTAIIPDAFRGNAAWNSSMVWSEFPKWLEGKEASGIGPSVDSSIEYLKSELGITKFAMIGFCWGGGAAHYMASQRDDLVGVVSCYGLMEESDPNFGRLNSPTLFIFGAADFLFPQTKIRGLRRALKKKTETKYAIRSYKGQGHAFVHRKKATPGDPDTVEIYAARKKMIQWLNKYLR